MVDGGHNIKLATWASVLRIGLCISDLLLLLYIFSFLTGAKKQVSRIGVTSLGSNRMVQSTSQKFNFMLYGSGEYNLSGI